MTLRETFALADDTTRLYVRHWIHPAPQFDTTVLLCDGIACDGFVWKYLWDFLGERCHVAHWNYRGHGRSSPPHVADHIELEHFAADLNAVRRELGDPQSLLLFGHSLGCQIALEGYRHRPQHIVGLGLICGAPGRVTHTFKGSDALAQLLPRLIARVDAHPHLARALWGSLPAGLALKIAAATGEIDTTRMVQDDLLPYLQHMVDIDLPMFLRMLHHAGEHTAEDVLPTIKVPTLVVAGDRDSFTPPRFAHAMADAIPGAELLLLQATHVAPLEQRGQVHDAVERLLERACRDRERPKHQTA